MQRCKLYFRLQQEEQRQGQKRAEEVLQQVQKNNFAQEKGHQERLRKLV
jgi:hypothetical protein